MTAIPKHPYVRSKKLMRAYRLIPCQHCGRDDGTVCGAHSNRMADGKGRGIKSDDNKCASLCHACHSALDQGSHLTRQQRETLHHEAHLKTVAELVRRGIWPVECPIPETRKKN
jgi:hypothetical protein